MNWIDEAGCLGDLIAGVLGTVLLVATIVGFFAVVVFAAVALEYLAKLVF